jgi:16S rRNA C1402 N4-methylase RsmH
MSWDGSDFYAFSTSTPTQKVEGGDSGLGRQRQVSGVILGGSRKDALLRRLREDKDLLLFDPESAEESKERREEYRRWVEEKFETAKKDEKEQEEGNIGGIRMALGTSHTTSSLVTRD